MRHLRMPLLLSEKKKETDKSRGYRSSLIDITRSFYPR
nr:MAG TPA: hypothetical protein [Caudoviricetes sp.]